MKKILVYSFAVIILVMIVGLLLVKWMLWEPTGIQKNSIVYHLMVPAELKSFPTWGETKAPEYDVVSIAEGMKPAVVRMHYATTINRDTFLAEAKKLQFNCPHAVITGEHCEKTLATGRYFELNYSLYPVDTETDIEVAYIVQG